MMTTDTLILGDLNAHHSSWYSSSTDTRGTMLESMVSGSNLGILNWDSKNKIAGQCQPKFPWCLISISLTSTNWQTNLGSDHLPILISLQMDVTITPIQHCTNINMKRANWDRYSREIEDKLSKRPIPTDCQKRRKDLACHYSQSSITPHTLWTTPNQHRVGSNRDIGKDESTRWSQIKRSNLARPARDERWDYQNNERT